MKADTNAGRLVRQVLAGEVWPALADRHAYRVGPDGQPFVLPGMGAVTLGVHCGDPATGYASDHLEPGASIRHRDPAATARREDVRVCRVKLEASHDRDTNAKRAISAIHFRKKRRDGLVGCSGCCGGKSAAQGETVRHAALNAESD